MLIQLRYFTMYKQILLIVIVCLCINLVSAYDWYLPGDINMGDFYSIKQGINSTFNWFNGKFNWTSIDNYNIFNGATLSFNETKLNNTIKNEGIKLGFNSPPNNFALFF